ncbi:fumarylacetoacetase [Reichenbachiella carrageenanivorans]|uniref:fumarylacetoacetase n=1 Tax=Reichenbachiella carrageenanivorans TaxID=2979869 RepID=A0ABY6CWJ6_9BACT|nr:fumarylacetoacetase [Reichenbachiella carrageenanivorans]UXX78272.1 fumarylacetoacetase [Reichenbachiella carrageenanivorans]
MNKSWIAVTDESDFPIQNIPFGIVKNERGWYAASRIGNYAINLAILQDKGYFSDLALPDGLFEKQFLNDFIALGKPITNQVRLRIQSLFDEGSTDGLRENTIHRNKILKEVQQVSMSLPVQIGDYTDFYSSEQHAFNVGCMFRDPDNALMPNWKHLPVGYHGRSSSIVVSGTDFHRPKGQQKPNTDEPPIFDPCKLLDFELEMGFVIGKGSELGESISTKNAADHIFGLCLFNDWSARDLQKWEYVPLGPFLAKNFASHLSPWIVTLEALEPFRTSGPEQDPKVLPYLTYEGEHHYDIDLEVYIETEKGKSKKVSESNFKYMYWNMVQQLAHHTVNGCNVKAGDMMASGTISGPEPHQYGSMLEIAWQGSKPVQMPDGTERKFIQDGDTVVMKGFGSKEGVRIGFGEVRAKVLPAK